LLQLRFNDFKLPSPLRGSSKEVCTKELLHSGHYQEREKIDRHIPSSVTIIADAHHSATANSPKIYPKNHYGPNFASYPQLRKPPSTQSLERESSLLH
jgi:hypothetical protein